MAEPSTPEGSPEEIPEEIPREPAGKKGAWWKIVAVVVVIVVIVSVLAVLYLLPSATPPANQAPSITQLAASTESTDVNKPVQYTAQATDPDSDTLTGTWNFGDGTNASGTFSSGTLVVNHTYSLSGNFIGLLSVSDGHNHTVTNDGNLLFVQAKLTAATVAQPNPCGGATCAIGQVIPVLGASTPTVQVGTAVTFNANGSWAYNLEWNNWTNHALGGTYNVETAAENSSLFTSFTYNWGDGSANKVGTSTAVGGTTHSFAAAGLYFVKLTVLYTRADLTGSPVSISTGYSVRVLAAAPTTQVKYPSIFTEVTIGEPQYLDPAVDYETAGGEVLQSTYETLVWYTEGSQSLTAIIPRLASAMPTISTDGLTYTFELRSNVTFHDGSHMTGNDVVYSIQRVLAIHDPSGPSWMLEQVLTNYVAGYTGGTVGAYAFGAFPSVGSIPAGILAALPSNQATWNTTTLTNSMAWAIGNSSVTVSSTDQYQVAFHLTHPYPAFVSVLAFTVASVVSQSCVNANGGLQWGAHNQNLDLGTVDCGTGPYYIDQWVPNQVIVLKAWGSYWRTKAAIAEVHIAKANDIATREFMLFSGDADTAYIGWNYQADVLNGNTPKYSYLSITKGLPTLNVDFMGFDQAINSAYTPDPWSMPLNFFSDVHVRKAFSYAFNYDQYITQVLFGGGARLNGALANGLLGYNPNIPLFAYDLAKAEAEFKLAIDPTTNVSYWTEGMSITLYYNSGNDARQTAALLLKTGLEALVGMGMGPVTVNVRALDWPVYLAALRHHGLGMFVLGWAPDYADPDDYATPFLHTGGTYPSWMSYSNTTLDGLLDAASSELNPTTRAGMYMNLTYDASVYDVPYIWLDQATNFHVERTWVHGWFYNSMLSGIYFYTLSKA